MHKKVTDKRILIARDVSEEAGEKRRSIKKMEDPGWGSAEVRKGCILLENICSDCITLKIIQSEGIPFFLPGT